MLPVLGLCTSSRWLRSVSSGRLEYEENVANFLNGAWLQNKSAACRRPIHCHCFESSIEPINLSYSMRKRLRLTSCALMGITRRMKQMMFMSFRVSGVGVGSFYGFHASDCDNLMMGITPTKNGKFVAALMIYRCALNKNESNATKTS